MMNLQSFRLAAWALGLAVWCVSQALAQPMYVPDAPADQPPAIPSFGPVGPRAALQPMGDPAAPEEAPPLKDRVRMQWDDSSIVLGELPEDAGLTIKSQLGQFEVKLKDVARIDRATEKNQFRVMFASGDRVTGAVKFADATLKTAWGEVPLATAGLVSLETGKLHSRPVYQSRLSPDGRTVVTLRQDYGQFEPQVANPDEPSLRGNASDPYGGYGSTPYPATAPSYSAPSPLAPSYPTAQ